MPARRAERIPQRPYDHYPYESAFGIAEPVANLLRSQDNRINDLQYENLCQGDDLYYARQRIDQLEALFKKLDIDPDQLIEVMEQTDKAFK